MTISLCSEPQARSLTDGEITQERNAHNTGLWMKGNIRMKEVRGQVPGITCNGAHAKSAINNQQASGYVRAEREWHTKGTGVEPLEWNPRLGPPSGTPEWDPRVGPRVEYLTLLAGVTRLTSVS